MNYLKLTLLLNILGAFTYGQVLENGASRSHKKSLFTIPKAVPVADYIFVQEKPKVCSKGSDKFISENSGNFAYLAMYVHICEWSEDKWSKQSKEPQKITKYLELWKKVVAGKAFSSKFTVEEYKALVDAKNKYDGVKSNPVAVGYGAGKSLGRTLAEKKINILTKSGLEFFLKLHNCELIDANAESVSKYFTDQLESNKWGGYSQIFKTLYEMEKTYQVKKSKGAPLKEQSCLKDFKSSPFELFASSVGGNLELLQYDENSKLAKNLLEKSDSNFYKLFKADKETKVGAVIEKSYEGGLQSLLGDYVP